MLEPHVGMRPVEVGLLGCEQVQVPLARGAVLVLDSCPAGAAEDRLPAVRRKLAVRSSPGPEPEALPFRRSGRRRERRAEPLVLIRHVVRDDVDDRADPEGAGLRDQLLRLLEGSERRVDRAVVGDVVARVCHRRRVPRVEPEGIDAEVPEVRQTRQHSREVARPVAVRVREAPDVHLVDDRLAPPAPIRERLVRRRGRDNGLDRLRGGCRAAGRFHAVTIAHSTIECKTLTK